MNVTYNYKLSFWEDFNIFKLCTTRLKNYTTSHHVHLAYWPSISHYNLIQLSASGVTQLGNGLCKALYSFQARQDDELNLEKGKHHSQIVELPSHVEIFNLNKTLVLALKVITRSCIHSLAVIRLSSNLLFDWLLILWFLLPSLMFAEEQR